MNWWIIRLIVLISILIEALALVCRFNAGAPRGEYLYEMLSYFSLVVLALAVILTFRQRTADWKDRPEKKRQLQIGKMLTLFIVVMVMLSAFMIFK